MNYHMSHFRVEDKGNGRNFRFRTCLLERPCFSYSLKIFLVNCITHKDPILITLVQSVDKATSCCHKGYVGCKFSGLEKQLFQRIEIFRLLFLAKQILYKYHRKPLFFLSISVKTYLLFALYLHFFDERSD